LNKIERFYDKNNQLRLVIFAVTNKCILNCEHCFEWQNLKSQESLSFNELKIILKKLQQTGISQVQISGGEPLCRLSETIELVKSAQPGTEFWFLTCGYELTYEKAVLLKKGGFIGVNISLDHWEEDEHNRFRRNKRSFYWITQAAGNIRKAGLLICFSICATKEFVTEENLWKYLLLAKSLGAGFIRILEARKVGRYANQDVELEEEHVKILEKFYLTVNSDPQNRSYPYVMYPGYRQRRIGCFGAGNRYLYIDSNGDIHACPFCQDSAGNILSQPLEDIIVKLRKTGCHKFQSNYSD
jgi:MoaA/NifB/PqqE/SkfB family radical SAM enzyme